MDHTPTNTRCGHYSLKEEYASEQVETNLFEHDCVLIVNTCALWENQKRVCIWVLNVHP